MFLAKRHNVLLKSMQSTVRPKMSHLSLYKMCCCSFNNPSNTSLSSLAKYYVIFI